MKYYSWTLSWKTGRGVAPTKVINDLGNRLEPIFSTEDTPAKFYGVLVSGNIDSHDWVEWNLKEVSLDEVLEEAVKVDSGAKVEDGKIVFSPLPILTK